MSKSNIVSSIQNSQESINKLQTLFQELHKDGSSNNSSDYLTQAAIQNFVLSFQELEAKEGAEERKGEEVDSRTKTKQILSQIELDFLNHLKKEKGFDEQETISLSKQDIMNRNEAHKDRLATLRREVKDQIEKYSKEIPTKAPYQKKMTEGEIAFPPTFKAQEIYQYSSEGIKNLTKDLIEESKTDLEAIGITLDKNIKYVISCFGSLARDEASPYSDLEFGVLLEDGIEDKLSAEKLEEVKEYFRNLTDLLNIKVINLGETTATIQNIKEVKELGLKIPTKNGVSFDGNTLGSCKTPLGNKRAIVKKIEEINQDKAKDVEFINSNNALSQTQKDERTAEISETIKQRISKLKEDEYELIMTPSQMAQFHNEKWYRRDRHLSTVLYTTDMLQASILEDGKELLESYRNETNKILNKEIEIDALSEAEQENILLSPRSLVSSLRSVVIDNRKLEKLTTLREKRAFNLLSESVGKFEPKAGRDQDSGKSFSPKYDFYRPATMLIDHLSYLYDIGNRNGEKSVWDRFDKLFVNNTKRPTPLPLSTEVNLNIEGISNLRWMIDRTLQIRLKNYISKDDQNEEMFLLDEYDEKVREELDQKGLGIYEREVFEVYYVMIPFYNDVNSFNESKGENTKEFSKKLYCDSTSFAKALIHDLFLHYEESIKCYEQFIEEYKANGQEKHPSFAGSLNNLGETYKKLGDYKRAIELFNQSIEEYKANGPEKHPSFAGILNNLGETYRKIGDYKGAIELHNQSLEIRKEVFGEKHPDVAMSLNNLGNAYGALGDHNRQIESLNRALEINKEILGEKHPNIAMNLNNLGTAYRSQGDYKKATELHNQALEISKEILGEKHPDVAMSLNNLGAAYISLGNTTRAIVLLNQSLEINKKTFGEKNPSVVDSLRNLGVAYGELGDHKKGMELLNQALEINKEIFDEKNPDVAASLNNLGSSYGKLGDHKKTIELLNQALEINKKVFDEKHPSVAGNLNNLGNAYGELGDNKRKIEFLNPALEIRKEVFGERHPDVAGSLNNLGNAYGALGDYNRAIELMNQALEINKEVFGEKHSCVAGNLINLGNAYGALGDNKRAIELFNQASEINKETSGERHPNVAKILNNLGSAYSSLGNYRRAIELHTQGLEISKEIFGEKHPSVAAELNNLGRAYGYLGNYKRAIELFNQALEINKEAFGKNHPTVAVSLNNLGNAYGKLGEGKRKIELLHQSFSKIFQQPLGTKEEVFAEKYPDAAASFNNLGNAYESHTDYKKQIELLNESLEIRKEIFDVKHPDIEANLYDLGNAYGKLGDYKRQVELLNQSLEISKEVFGKNHPTVAKSLYNLGNVYNVLQDYPKAFESAIDALEIFLDLYDKDHPLIQEVAKLCSQLRKKAIDDLNKQGCRNHSKSLIEDKNGNREEATQLLELAQSNFSRALDYGNSSNTCAAIANFYFKQLEVIEKDCSNFLFTDQEIRGISKEEDIFRNKNRIILFSEKAIELKDDNSSLFYDKEGMEILPKELKKILEEEISKTNNESAKITIAPVYLAYFLLIKINLGQESENEQKSNNKGIITNLLTQFREELEQGKMKGVVEESVISIGEKLYDNFISLVQNQENEEELDEEEELKKAIELSNQPMAQTISEIPSTSTAEANAQNITQDHNVEQERK